MSAEGNRRSLQDEKWWSRAEFEDCNKVVGLETSFGQRGHGQKLRKLDLVMEWRAMWVEQRVGSRTRLSIIFVFTIGLVCGEVFVVDDGVKE